MKYSLLCLIVCIQFCWASPWAVPQDKNQPIFPANLLMLDGVTSHHVAVVEKSTHKLHLFENSGTYPKYINSFTIATGKKAGNKLSSGDHRTPEGIYRFTSFLSDQDLVKKYGEVTAAIYGAGAFVMNYPNTIDARQGKTGGGIWLHSTNDDTRISKGLDSRGCVVVVDADLKDISRYIELMNTPIIVVHDLKLLRQETYESNRQALKEVVEGWMDAWKTENLEDYLSFYHPEKFKDSYRGNFSQFKSYKKAVFAGKGTPQIKMKNITILADDQYAVIDFTQDYQSNTIQDIGRKTLYLQKDGFYRWKIVAEQWQKEPEETNTGRVAFTPSNRFFKEEQSGQAN